MSSTLAVPHEAQHIVMSAVVSSELELYPPRCFMIVFEYATSTQEEQEQLCDVLFSRDTTLSLRALALALA